MTDSRVTQAGFEVGSVADPLIRITQAGFEVGFQQSSPMRITQAGFEVGVRFDTPACLTREADLWKITRTDGVTFRFTSHNRAMSFRGETYTPCKGITASALQLSANIGDSDNIDLDGLVSAGAVSVVDLWARLFDDATVEIWRAAWDGSGYSELLFAGTCGALDLEDTTYRFEVVSAGQRLTQNAVLQSVTAACRYELGEARCGVNLAAFTVTGSVTAVAAPNLRTSARRRSFTDSARGEATNYWQFAKLTWTSGSNAGITCDVLAFGSGVFVLSRSMPYDIDAADAYSIIRGCDKLPATCNTVFSNKINFGGFEYLRGNDDLNKTPKDGV